MESREAEDETFRHHLTAAAEGSEPSFTWLITTFSPPLVTQSRYRIRGPLARQLDAEDLVQEAWLEICSGWLPAAASEAETWSTSRFLGYVGGMIRFLALRYRRRLHFRAKDGGYLPGEISVKSGILTDAMDRRVSLTLQIMQREDLRETLAAIDALDPIHREALTVRGVENARNASAAHALGIEPATMAKRYQRALEALDKALGRRPLFQPEE